MKSLFIIGLNIFTVIFLMACNSSDSKRLEQALLFAGENRGELEKVLTHYENNPEKLEAARFLIRNMPRWYGYEGWQLDSIKPVLIQKDKGEVVSKDVIEKWQRVSFYSLPKVYDAKVITADYLIENIDLAFDVWKKYPWNRSLGFDDFCELILPYRIGDEPLSSWRKLYHDYYTAILDSAYQGDDVIEACKAVDKDLKKVYYRWDTDFSIPHQSADFLFYHRVGFCREACDVTLYAMRACGIPVACEYFVYSPEYQHPHYWTTLRDTTGKFIQFGFNEFEASRTNPGTDGRKKGKVYRYCFGLQEESISGITADEKVPALFRDRFIKDVTANYYGENEVSLSVQSAFEDFIYLGVFSPSGWIPVDIAINNKGNVTFKNLEPNIIYQPLVSDGQNHQAVGYPFIYTKKKNYILKPDVNKLKKAVLQRKMSVCGGYKDFPHRGIIGSQIEASLYKDFSQADLLFRFNDTLRSNYYELIPPDINKQYRYIRYVGPPDNIMELAELAVFADSTGKESLHLNRMNDPLPTASLDNITDGDILSYFSSKDSACFITYDLGKITPIQKIVFSPRNDDNYVWPGDKYELFYQDGTNGWKSLGVQTATRHELEYLVPDKSLLWLRNRTKGREEQVFIYKGGKQLFNVDL
ncbi:hypothetical protein DXD68_19235 [Parabacteroides sp. TM07-1AC]|uniref:discoidin domain-containing protein n=1 Tax=Parabacteroides sp. TM07-1AC TaxID=2292363 RepID=UPI000EFDD1B0|nr:discoidin domain-containing protein [Parabacteroides sp. TM07-1AC]RHU23220.1 hypothetical protein DXD68_19235 [Parabacteroides sp. TM07-1AC]